jgi:1,4-dihydroxy-2-naphthoyl-CoA hydrolase
MDIRRLRTADEWNARGAENLPGLVGIVFEKVEPTEVVARVTVRKALMAPNGYLHAGTVGDARRHLLRLRHGARPA